MNITLTIPGLGCGGAERVICWLANRLAARRHNVTLLAVRPEPVFYTLDERVNVKQAKIVTPDAAGGMTRTVNFARRVKWLRREISASKPDVVIAFEDVAAVLTLSAVSGKGIPVIVSERVNPEYHSIPGVYANLRKIVYPKAAAIVMQTSDLVGWAARFVDEKKVRVIPNPVFVPPRAGPEPDFFEDRNSHVLAVGRFTRQKGFDILLQAFSLLPERYNHWRLVILGDGEKRESLESKIVELGLSGRVIMPGVIRNIASAFDQSDIFVLSSRYEGFPNALCEAMACGMAVISFDCPSGPADIITSGEDGILVPPENAAELLDALTGLMDAPSVRDSLGKRAQDIVERFGEPAIMEMWDKTIRKAAGSK